jgi:hypothetical protein
MNDHLTKSSIKQNAGKHQTKAKHWNVSPQRTSNSDVQKRQADVLEEPIHQASTTKTPCKSQYSHLL